MTSHLAIRPFRPADQAALVALWRECNLVVPLNDPDADIALKLADSPELLLLADQDGRIVGSAMVGYDGHRGHVNYLAVAPDRRNQGVGRRLMEEAEQRLAQLGCPKINLLIRNSNVAVKEFYAAIGYKLDEVVCLSKRLT